MYSSTFPEQSCEFWCYVVWEVKDTPHSHSSRFNVRVLCLFVSIVLTKYQHSKLQTTRQACRHCCGTLSETTVHSLPNFAPRRVGSRTSSRPSLYPPNRFFKIIISPEKAITAVTEVKALTATPALHQVSINTNTISVAPSIDALKPLSSLAVDTDPKRENTFGLVPNVRPRSVMTCISFLSTYFLYLLAFRSRDTLSTQSTSTKRMTYTRWPNSSFLQPFYLRLVIYSPIHSQHMLCPSMPNIVTS